MTQKLTLKRITPLSFLVAEGFIAFEIGIHLWTAFFFSSHLFCCLIEVRCQLILRLFESHTNERLKFPLAVHPFEFGFRFEVCCTPRMHAINVRCLFFLFSQAQLQYWRLVLVVLSMQVHGEVGARRVKAKDKGRIEF